MNWTKKLPNQEGYYWQMADSAATPSIVRVVKHDKGHLVVYVPGTSLHKNLSEWQHASPERQWLGPVQPNIKPPLNKPLHPTALQLGF